MARATIEITHADRGWPDIEIHTRKPTRYDVIPTTGRVPDDVPSSYRQGSLRFSPGTNGGVNVSLVTLGMTEPVILKIDREDFVEFSRQIERLASRVSVGM